MISYLLSTFLFINSFDCWTQINNVRKQTTSNYLPETNEIEVSVVSEENGNITKSQYKIPANQYNHFGWGFQSSAVSPPMSFTQTLPGGLTRTFPLGTINSFGYNNFIPSNPWRGPSWNWMTPNLLHTQQVQPWTINQINTISPIRNSNFYSKESPDEAFKVFEHPFFKQNSFGPNSFWGN